MAKRRKNVSGPSYGDAPLWLVKMSKDQVEEVYACFDAGYGLSSKQMLHQKRCAEAIARRILEENAKRSEQAG